MRKKRNGKKFIIVIALCVSALVMGIGYAIISASLNINNTNSVEGQWKVSIQSITATDVHGSAVSRKVNKSNDGLKASFVVDLYDEGDYVEYTIVVKNSGNINALLDDVVSSIQHNNQYISMTNTLEYPESRIGEKLAAGASMSFKVRIAVNGTESELVDSSGSIYNIELRYLQDEK